MTTIAIGSYEELSALKEELIGRSVARKMGVSYTSSPQLDRFNAHFEQFFLASLEANKLLPGDFLNLTPLTIGP